VVLKGLSHPLDTLVFMELTAEQEQVAGHRAGRLRVAGAPGTGRTTALVARYRRAVAEHRPSEVLVVCRDRAAATRFRHAVLPHLAGGFDALPVTTWYGVAFDVVTRARGTVHLLSGAEQRGTVRRLLALEEPAAWPGLAPLLGREAMVDEVAAGVLAYQAADPARGAAAAGPWAELAGFAERYASHLQARGQVDRAGLLAAAASLAAPGRYAEVLVDDAAGDGAVADRLLAALTGPATRVTTVGGADASHADVALTRRFRHPAQPALVACGHPALEPEAVAAELLAARGEGVAWSQMAVLARRPRSRGKALGRALARHGVPVAADPGAAAADDPAVAAIVDVLRWAAGEELAFDRLLASPISGLSPVDVRDLRRHALQEGVDLRTHPRLAGLAALRDEVAAAAATADPAALAFLVWRRGLPHLVSEGARPADDATLDAVVSFLDGLERQVAASPALRLPDLVSVLDDGAFAPDPWRAAAGAVPAEAVTVTSIAEAAGREWHTVVLTGCVEGELPRVATRAPLFDPAVLSGDDALSPAERRQAALADERRLFALACSRATSRLVGTAAPEPGVLLSRFVEGWSPGPARRLAAPGPAPAWLPPTQSDVPVFPGEQLVLSASQLDTYDDCPLRYAYQYGLRVRDDAGPAAALGSLVHAVLAAFLDPGSTRPRTRATLLALAAELWRDDIARYRPQVEECRRDYFGMLDAWWDGEGATGEASDVVAVERAFEVDAAGHRLVGSIDRVDRVDGGLRILDYKTGRHEPRPDDLPDDIQLAVYHLAATRDPGLAALGPARQLRLLYVRSMHRFEQPVVEGHAELTEARVADAAARIGGELFEPAADASCRTCAFHRLCPLQPEGRQVGTR
jgi:superfamily I DNA/RNA helicase/RecB family exonuclease